MINLTFRGPSITIKAFGWVFVMAFGEEVAPVTASQIIREMVINEDAGE